VKLALLLALAVDVTFLKSVFQAQQHQMAELRAMPQTSAVVAQRADLERSCRENVAKLNAAGLQYDPDWCR
jgi:hypothetical protein